MKKALFTSILSLLIATGTIVRAQDKPDEYLGLPGDNLNLYAVMSLFQESETLEGFERKLNEQNSRINNLDLNGDNFVDYIMVTDYVDGQDHNIVMSVALNNNERQDVGVFTVQKLRNGEVAIQLIGDEELYGRNYIIEPIYDDNNGETPNPGYNGRNNNRQNVTVIRTNYYEVAAWPMIRFIYRPDYVVWRSSWRWGYYPSYWQPWSPFYYHYYYGYYSNWYPEYYRHYRHWHQPRYTRYNTFYYTNVRVFSPTVSVRVKEGNYKTTYSRPESRRDGEALYKSTRTNSDVRSNRTSTSTDEGRKSVSTQSGDRSAGSTTTRTNTRTNTKSDSKTINNTGTIRRSDNPTSVKSGTSGSSGQNAASSRRQSNSGSDRAATKPAATKSTGTVSRTRETTTKSSAPARTTTKSSTPARSSTKATKSESSSRSTSSKEKENSSSSATKRR
ncbi:MAG: hypothetical protein IPJ16_08055 [Bacteroidales bacterium]|nr:hypothetical protein [Bacteroidales bacterium]